MDHVSEKVPKPLGFGDDLAAPVIGTGGSGKPGGDRVVRRQMLSHPMRSAVVPAVRYWAVSGSSRARHNRKVPDAPGPGATAQAAGGEASGGAILYGAWSL